MNHFAVNLQGATQCQTMERIVSFVGQDESGSFGIMADHARLITCLSFGLATVREIDGKKWFLALPGGVLYFVDNGLFICSRMFYLSVDENEILEMLSSKFIEVENNLETLKRSLHQMDEEMILRLWKLTKRPRI